METCILFLLFQSLTRAQKPQILRFQVNNVENYSTEEWVEYKGKIPHMNSFTACHWERLRFFSVRDSCPWAYCYKNKNVESDHHCIQLWYNRDAVSGGRHIIASGGFGDNSYGDILMKTFKHRSWNQICWTFQSETGMNKMYLNGVLQGSYIIDSDFVREGIPGSDEVFSSAFILGQEPDPPSPRGGFEKEQVFVGDVTELNMWNFILEESIIKDMGKCKRFEKGNIISWNLESFEVNNVKVEELEGFGDLCKSENELLVFPNKRSWPEAWSLCYAHGGIIHTPENQKENDEFIRVMKPYEAQCADSVSKNLAWLGIKSRKRVWYKIGKNKQLANQNFTNWKSSYEPYFANYDCGFIQVGGTWDSDQSVFNCNTFLRFCTVCKTSGNSLMILKGVCDGSPIDWLFYVQKDKHKNIFYEGYKNSKIVFKNGSWHMTDYAVTQSDLIVHMDAGKHGSKTPLGRRSWKTYDASCGLKSPEERSLTLSICIFGDEFTCDSGECVDIFTRCDKKYDCVDRSDERGCMMIQPLTEYEKSSPPELEEHLMRANPIFTVIEILNIDFINTVSMSVGLTVEIHLTWRDPRLFYKNILDGKGKLDVFKDIAEREVEKIWLPMPRVIHENAVIGQVVEDNIFYVKIIGKSSPTEMDITESVETLLYPGAENDLFMSQRYKLEYRCTFYLKTFPFDKQACDFILMMNREGNHTINLAEGNPPLIYLGPRILQSFELTDLFTNTSASEHQTRLIYSLEIERLYMHTLSTTFFQSFILWVIAYFTLYINTADFSNRFMGALTSLLVLAALLSSIDSSLPQTSYFKHIDVWFFCFIINIVLIIFVHIAVDIFLNRENDHRVAPKSSLTMLTNIKSDERKLSTKINNVAKITIPIFITFFIVTYFVISTAE